MSRKNDPLETGKKDLIFVPLGGAGEIGMNLNLIGHAGKWLMLDLGVTFGDDQTPGVDVIMPDPQFIAARKHPTPTSDRRSCFRQAITSHRQRLSSSSGSLRPP